MQFFSKTHSSCKKNAFETIAVQKIKAQLVYDGIKLEYKDGVRTSIKELENFPGNFSYYFIK